MLFEPTAIPDVIRIRPKVFADARGFFMETWQNRSFEAAGIHAIFVQDNHSRSQNGTLRGLHYQVRQPQGKLVRVTVGDVFDVAVDIRRSSPTFGRWIGERLSDENKHMLWVPPGFAHGFYVLSDTAEFQYKCTDYYVPQYERCIAWNDPAIGIQWPIPAGEAPFLSEKDSAGLALKCADVFE